MVAARMPSAGVVVDPGQIEAARRRRSTPARWPAPGCPAGAGPASRASTPEKYSWLPVTKNTPCRARSSASGATASQQRLDRAVDHVTGDGDDVGRQGVGPADDVLDERAADGGAHVQVGQLHDGRAVAGGGQPAQANLDLLHGHRAQSLTHGKHAGGGRAEAGQAAQRARQQGPPRRIGAPPGHPPCRSARRPGGPGRPSAAARTGRT